MNVLFAHINFLHVNKCVIHRILLTVSSKSHIIMSLIGILRSCSSRRTILFNRMINNSRTVMDIDLISDVN